MSALQPRADNQDPNVAFEVAPTVPNMALKIRKMASKIPQINVIFETCPRPKARRKSLKKTFRIPFHIFLRTPKLRFQDFDLKSECWCRVFGVCYDMRVSSVRSML